MLLQNGLTFTASGERHIAFDKAGVVKPVVKSQKTGHQTHRTTFQDVELGDFVISVSWKGRSSDTENALTKQLRSSGVIKETSFTTVRKVVGAKTDGAYQLAVLSGEDVKLDAAQDSIVTAEEASRFLTIKDNDPVLTEWMRPTARGESYLPAGYGWDGVQTLSDIAKVNRITDLFKGAPTVFVERVLEEAKWSKSIGLPTNWFRFSQQPKKGMEFAAGYNEEIVWVLWAESGEIIVLDKTALEQFENVTTISFPSVIVRSCEVVFNCYKRAGDPYGVKWTLFEHRANSKQGDKKPYAGKGNKKPFNKKARIATPA